MSDPCDDYGIWHDEAYCPSKPYRPLKMSFKHPRWRTAVVLKIINLP